MPDLPPPGTHRTRTAAEAKEVLAELTGWPADMIHGYAYLLTGRDGVPLCFGSNGATREDAAKLLRDAALEAERLEDYPDD
jgi:hypothetical protein